MGTIGAIVPLILIVIMSAIVVRIAAIMLKMTGLEEKKARFQALSAFTGTGFTTRDSELITGHDMRRKIVMVLMILGNAGIISFVTTFILSFLKGESGAGPVSLKLAILAAALFLINRAASNKRITRWVNDWIEDKIADSKILEKKPLEEIMNLPKGYGVCELHITDKNDPKGRTLQEAEFREKDILVLNIEKKDRIISSPKANDTIEPGDTLICYGPLNNIRDFSF